MLEILDRPGLKPANNLGNNPLKRHLEEDQIPPTQRRWDVFTRGDFLEIFNQYPATELVADAIRLYERRFNPDLSIRDKVYLWKVLAAPYINGIEVQRVKNGPLLSEELADDLDNIKALLKNPRALSKAVNETIEEDKARLNELNINNQKIKLAENEIIKERFKKRTVTFKSQYERWRLIRCYLEKGLSEEEITSILGSKRLFSKRPSQALNLKLTEPTLSDEELEEIITHEVRYVANNYNFLSLPDLIHPLIDAVTSAQIKFLLQRGCSVEEIAGVLNLPKEVKDIIVPPKLNPEEITLKDVTSENEYQKALKLLEYFGKVAKVFKGNAGFFWDERMNLGGFMIEWQESAGNWYILEFYIKEKRVSLSLQSEDKEKLIGKGDINRVECLEFNPKKGILEIQLSDENSSKILLCREGVDRVISPKAKNLAL